MNMANIASPNQKYLLPNWLTKQELSKKSAITYAALMAWMTVFSIADTKEKTAELVQKAHDDFLSQMPKEAWSVLDSTLPLVFGEFSPTFSEVASRYDHSQNYFVQIKDSVEQQNKLIDYIRQIMLRAGKLAGVDYEMIGKNLIANHELFAKKLPEAGQYEAAVYLQYLIAKDNGEKREN